VRLPFLLLRCLLIDLFLHLKLVSSDRGVAYGKCGNLPVSFDLSVRPVSLEEWIHDEDCLEDMRHKWGGQKNILEVGRGVLAEKEFKECQGLGCEENP